MGPRTFIRVSAPPLLYGALLIAACAASPAAEIPEGTHVLMQIENTITTRTAQPGDKVYLRSVSPIIAGGRVVAPAGCFAQATVTSVKRGGRVKGRAELGLRLDSLALPNGRVFQVAARLDSVDAAGTSQAVDKQEGIIRQGSGAERDAVVTATRSAQGAALGAIVDRGAEGAAIGAGAGAAAGLAQVLLTRGRDVELRRGATVDVIIERKLVAE